MAESSRSEPHAWPFVRTLLEYEWLDSTSTRAAELVREECTDLPMAVWARNQTRGRGRGSHAWWSDPGSLTFTLAIDPLAHGLAVEHEPKLALASAVAVIDALRETGLGSPSMGIRWPNDVEVDGRKLAGILPEHVELIGGRRVLVGIGINVFTSVSNAPEEVRSMATSLAALQEDPLDDDILPRLLATILRHFEGVLIRLVHSDASLWSSWNDLDRLRDQWISVDLGGRVVAGLGRGIDNEGALLLDDGQQQIRLFGGQVLRR